MWHVPGAAHRCEVMYAYVQLCKIYTLYVFVARVGPCCLGNFLLQTPGVDSTRSMSAGAGRVAIACLFAQRSVRVHPHPAQLPASGPLARSGSFRGGGTPTASALKRGPDNRRKVSHWAKWLRPAGFRRRPGNDAAAAGFGDSPAPGAMRCGATGGRRPGRRGGRRHGPPGHPGPPCPRGRAAGRPVGRCPRVSIRCPVPPAARPCGWPGCGRR